MIWENLELFNVEEIEESGDGIRLYRFPKNTIHQIGRSYFNRYVARMTTGCEIRFVGEAMLTLAAIEEDGFVEIFRGDFYVEKHLLKKGERKSIHLKYDHHLDQFPLNGDLQYSKDVWRVVFAHDFCGALCNVDPYSTIRPPKKEELPSKVILAYGSSITHGANANLFSASYLARTGVLLHTQMLNKGMGGSCFCEKEMGDYIKTAECDGIMLELGVNMMGIYSTEEFYERASYIVRCALSTGKKVALISPYLHSRDFSYRAEERQISVDYEQVCKRIALEHDDLIFIDGKQILSDITLLSADLVHPSMFGHHIMAERLSGELLAKGFLN